MMSGLKPLIVLLIACSTIADLRRFASQIPTDPFMLYVHAMTTTTQNPGAEPCDLSSYQGLHPLRLLSFLIPA